MTEQSGTNPFGGQLEYNDGELVNCVYTYRSLEAEGTTNGGLFAYTDDVGA